MPIPKVEIKSNPESLTIYIKGYPHLYIEGEVLGFQSWVDGYRKPRQFIKFKTLNKSYTTEYDNVKLWLHILKILDKQLIKN